MSVRRKSARRLKVGDVFYHDGRKLTVTRLEWDGDVRVIETDHGITVRRTGGVKMEMVK